MITCNHRHLYIIRNMCFYGIYAIHVERCYILLYTYYKKRGRYRVFQKKEERA